MKKSLWIPLVALTLGACQSGGDSITWREGDFTGALEQAKRESKPLLVYWGAVWCPPCNSLKANVFTNPAFVSATRGFLAVHLDGDTPEAQSWGEKLGASGYPTLMVLTAEGKEALRLNTVLGATELAEALNRAHASLAPIEDVARKVLEGGSGESVPQETWRILSSYAWDMRPEVTGDPYAKAEPFEKFDAMVPAQYAVEKSRFFLRALELKVRAYKGTLPKDSRTTAIGERLATILKTPELLEANLKPLTYSGASWVKAIDVSLQAPLLAGMEAARTRAGRTAHERLLTFAPGVELGVADTKTLPAEVKKALYEARDPQSHSFLLDTGTALLDTAGLHAEAERVLLDHMRSSKAPWYEMLSLSEVYDSWKKPEKALEWAEKAYRRSEGQATRLQWGTAYLITLSKAKPQDKDTILSETEKFLDANLQTPDAFRGRNKTRLDKLSRELTQWAKGSQLQPQVVALARKFRERCPADGPCAPYFDAFGR